MTDKRLAEIAEICQRTKCRDCEGLGSQWDSYAIKSITCPECKGDGTKIPTHIQELFDEIDRLKDETMNYRRLGLAD